ncbi:putative ribonuclease H-like domain-containing protein, partial [Tanacetum coccineum]
MYTQQEGIYYDEVFALVARIKAIRLFLAYASFKDFVVYQMDVNSAFLYGKIEEEVYVCQPLGFEDPEFPDKVYKRGQIDKTLFIKKIKVTQKDDGIFISQDKYVEEILKKFSFSTVKTASTPMETSKPLLKDAEAEDVDVHLYRSMIGSLIYLTASRPDIMFVVCSCTRIQVTPKGSHLHAMKRIFRYLKGQPKLGLWYPKDSPFDLEAYTDSDYVGASLDRKSTTGGCQFLESRLFSWQCKKQTIVSTYTTEAEYVVAASCYGQVLWIQNQMLDYGYNFMNTNIFIDNESTICIVKNPVFHSKTKHIEIRHYEHQDTNEKKLFKESTQKPRKAKKDTEISQSSGHIPLVTDETVIKEWEDRMERDATNASSLEAEQDSEAQTRFKDASKQSNDPPLSRVNTLGSGEDSMKQKELMEFSDETIHEKRGDSVEMVATTATSLDVEQGSGNINRTQSMATLNEPIPQGIGSGSGPRYQDTKGDRPAQTSFERLSKQSNEPPLSRVNTLGSGEDSMKLQELMDLCTKLSDRVLDLENVKDAQALEIQKLKKRVNNLESKKKSRTLQLKRRLFKVRIESSAEKSLGDQEDSSKQGRNESDQDEGISWFQEDSETQGRYGYVIRVNTASIPITTASTTITTAEPVTTASITITTAEPVTTASAPITTVGVSVSTAEPSTPPPPTTTTTLIEDEDLNIAQTFIKMKSEKSKAKGVTMQEPSESGTRVRVPPPQIDLKDKGKAKMVEPEKRKKKKDQIKYDADVAQRLQAELDEEAMLEREREEGASKAANIAEWDDVQAMMDADYELAIKLQAEEQDGISIEERSKLFVELMNERKKHFARLRVEEQRRKPPTKTQKRNLMSTYLKNMAG